MTDTGVPGASARREHERRRAAREKRVRERHPRLGGLFLAMSDDPQSTKAWQTGAVGEEVLGARLNQLAGPLMRPLHDRRVPGKRSNIDHLAVTPTGVFVIDAKRYRGRPRLHVSGGLLRPRVEQLTVGSRDCTKLLDGIDRQLEVVRSVVGDEVPVTGVLCFIDADWPAIGGAFVARGITVTWPRKLCAGLRKPGPMAEGEIADLHELLASALPPA